MNIYEKIQGLTQSGKVYIIAELGSNYRDYTDMVNAISIAKNIGADAIKFQYFHESELYGPAPQLNPNQFFERFQIKAERVGIDLICSTFSPEGLNTINPYVCAHKIASCEMSHIRLIEAAKKTGKPIILSTGAYGVADVRKSVDFIQDNFEDVPVEERGKYPLILMHCNVSYPAKFVDMDKFHKLKSIFVGPLGFSDHTTSIDIVPSVFKEQGATVYEKHWNPYELTDTPDAPHSLTTEEFKTMVSYLRGEPSHFNEEHDARLKYIRRIIAIRDLTVGEMLKENYNIGIYRSKIADARGANPFSIDSLVGKRANKEIKMGTGVSFMDVQ